MERERNLLFGVFGVQLGKITPHQLAGAASAWAAGPSRELPERLVESGALSASDRALLDHLVDAAVEAHGGNAEPALASFGGQREVDRSFGDSLGTLDEGQGARQDGAPQTVREAPGRYVDAREHGRGGMGRVLLARDAYLGREVALKELLPAGGETATGRPHLTDPFVARFAQEARITGQLEHPGIVPVYELGERGGGTLYYTMKFVRGRSLAEAIREAPDVPGRLGLLPHFVDLAQALAYAHSRGVVHRDIKPGNVMIGAFGETVVIDWGLAKHVGERDVHEEDMSEALTALSRGDDGEYVRTKSGRAMGTPAYMAPEQARGRLDAIDARTDVYALGAVLYEMLTGQPPIDGASLAEVAGKAMRGDVPPVREVEPEAPPELAAVCERAMRTDPAQRYQTASELVADAQDYLAGRLVAAYDYRVSEHVRRFARRHWKALATAAAALLAGVGALAAHNLQLMRANALAQEQREAAVAAQRRAERAQELETVQRRRAEAEAYAATLQESYRMIGSGQGGRAAERLKESPPRLRHWAWGFLMRRALDPDARRPLSEADIAPGEDLALRPRIGFSADGRLAKWLRPDGSLEVWDVAEGRRVFTAPILEAPIAMTLQAPGLAAGLLPARDGADAVAKVTCRSPYRDATLHPAGTALIAVTAGRQARGWALPGGEPLPVPDTAGYGVNSARFAPDGSRLLTAHESHDFRQWSWPSFELLRAAHRGDAPGQFCFFLPGTAHYLSQQNDKALALFTFRGAKSIDYYGHIFADYPYFGGQAIARDGWMLRPHGNQVDVWRFQPGGNPGHEETVLAGLGGSLRACAITLDARRAATVTAEGVLDLWEPRAARRLLRAELTDLMDASADVACAAFCPEGRRLALGLADGRLAVWSAIPWAEGAWEQPASREELARAATEFGATYPQRAMSEAGLRETAQALAEAVRHAPAVADLGVLLGPGTPGLERAAEGGAVLTRVNDSGASREELLGALEARLKLPETAPLQERTLRLETLGYLTRTVTLLWPADAPLWEEDWEKGEISPDFYEVFGTPEPVLREGLGGKRYALNPNGDGMHESGVNARRIFDLSHGGFALEWRACPLAGGSERRSHHQMLDVSICYAGSYLQALNEPGHLDAAFRVVLRADSEGSEEESPQLRLQSEVIATSLIKHPLGEAALGQWHAFRLTLQGDRIMLSMNGADVFEDVIDRSGLQEVQLVLRGRAYMTETLIDDIRLTRTDG